ncbi:MAG: methyltransferase domain-containing protein [Oscillospiraceae bacterium]|nr:methyltransferase domain-containing protein [Oscillospiraceae bacterium]
MDFYELSKIKDEYEQINRTYDIFNEDTRLHSKATRVEFLTTVKYIEKYLRPGMKILDIGAGAGEYSLYFAEKGYEVSALELADNNIAAFRRKIKPEHKIELIQGNAVDLSHYPDKRFDIVLMFGPLYHLHSEEDRQKAIAEAKRVAKSSAVLFFAFIGNDMIFVTELNYDANYIKTGDYNKETFKMDDFPFVFHTVDGCRKILENGGINIIHEVASDGVSELMAKRINEMDEEDYEVYLRYHYYCCEKPEMLGRSNHLLFVGRLFSLED